MTIRNIIAIVIVVACFLSCDQDSVFDDFQTIPNGWNIDEPMRFSIEDIDTTQNYDLFISLRNTNDYKYANLFLITTLEYPHGKQDVDTLEYAMAAPNGEWLGKGFNDVKESKLWYKENIRFRESGNYTINIVHAVRKNGNVQGDKKLQGITEVGVRLEYSKN